MPVYSLLLLAPLPPRFMGLPPTPEYLLNGRMNDLSEIQTSSCCSFISNPSISSSQCALSLVILYINAKLRNVFKCALVYGTFCHWP